LRGWRERGFFCFFPLFPNVFHHVPRKFPKCSPRCSQ
jgi:hypothetical protein